jgi:PIN domain nuclease of toxin-antitoxin system
MARSTTIAMLDVRTEHALAVAHLPWHHRDPFDRLLVAQASVDALTLLSADAALDRYAVARIW